MFLLGHLALLLPFVTKGLLGTPKGSEERAQKLSKMCTRDSGDMKMHTKDSGLHRKTCGWL